MHVHVHVCAYRTVYVMRCVYVDCWCIYKCMIPQGICSCSCRCLKWRSDLTWSHLCMVMFLILKKKRAKRKKRFSHFIDSFIGHIFYFTYASITLVRYHFQCSIFLLQLYTCTCTLYIRCLCVLRDLYLFICSYICTSCPCFNFNFIFSVLY